MCSWRRGLTPPFDSLSLWLASVGGSHSLSIESMLTLTVGSMGSSQSG